MSDPQTIYKYHGTGNDFVVLRDDHPLAHARWARHVCDRHRGIGADGLLILSDSSEHDVKLSIINADGSRPEMCGNGVRCVARYLVEREGFAPDITVESDAGPRPIRVVERGDREWRVAVDMGPAQVDPAETELVLGQTTHRARKVDMGNPHAVIFVEEMPHASVVDEWGAWVNDGHAEFPAGVNLEFVVVGGDRCDVVVYERGVGRTQACGTGACAVAAAAWHEGRTRNRQTVVGLPGGDLLIEERETHVWMTGGVEAVFSATVDGAWVEQRKEARQGR